MSLELFSTRIDCELKKSIKEFCEIKNVSTQKLVKNAIEYYMSDSLKHERKCSPKLFEIILDKHGFKKVYEMSEEEFSTEIDSAYEDFENAFKLLYGEV